MNGEILWKKILLELPKLGEELKTLHKGHWFRVFPDKEKLTIDKAIDNSPTCNITMRRTISKKDFLFVYSYYDRWLSGEKE